MYYDS
jgi:hypothetical protein